MEEKNITNVDDIIKRHRQSPCLTSQDTDKILKSLSLQYNDLLSQIGKIENQMEDICTIQTSIESQNNLIRIATLPLIVITEFIKTLKTSSWAKVSWHEKEPAIPQITQYARLVDIYVEPNKIWDGIVQFAFSQRGYVTESDYAVLGEKYPLREDYHIK